MTTSATGGTVYQYTWERKDQGGDWEAVEVGNTYAPYVTAGPTYFDLRVTATSNNKTGTQTKRVNITIQ